MIHFGFQEGGEAFELTLCVRWMLSSRLEGTTLMRRQLSEWYINEENLSSVSGEIKLLVRIRGFFSCLCDAIKEHNSLSVRCSLLPGVAIILFSTIYLGSQTFCWFLPFKWANKLLFYHHWRDYLWAICWGALQLENSFFSSLFSEIASNKSFTD